MVREARGDSRLAAIASATLLVAVLSGCGSAPKRDIGVERAGDAERAPAVAGSRARGGYYLDDGPGAAPPPDLHRIPEPIPRLEPLRAANMRPYTVMGQSFTPMTELGSYRARGIATWYGRRYHGKPTSSGEIYDMYGISAAHPTLPIPSYARVTNLANGKSVVVRINDRGPFIDHRLIDLSYTAAHRIGLIASGSAMVEVEAIIPEEVRPAIAAASVDLPVRVRAHTAQGADKPAQAAPPEDASQTDPIEALLAAGSEVPRPSTEVAFEIGAPAAADRASTKTSAVVYLQLGAFATRANAERYLARARPHLDGLTASIHVVALDGLYRVHAGPYASAFGARAEADHIAAALGVRPVLVTRHCADAQDAARAAARC